MSLHIIRATEPLEVSQLIITAYGPPGLGKTSLAFTAESPLLLDFDEGAYRAANRGDTVICKAWVDAASISASDLKDYQTLIIDTAGRALDKLTADIILNNPKASRGGGQLTLQGYGELKARFTAYLKMVRSLGLDIILVAHSEEQRGNNDDMIERIDIVGGSKAEIYKSADAMGRLAIKGGQRTLNFSPSDVSFGKNPAQLPVLQVPDYSKEPKFLAGVIQSIKAKLNESSGAALAETARIRELRESFERFEDADAFTKQVAKMAKAQPKDKTLLVEVAKEKGFVFDKAEKAFKATGATA